MSASAASCRSSAAWSVARHSTVALARAAIALTPVPPSTRPTLTDSGAGTDAIMLVSSRASSCTALGRPRSHHECPPGPVTVSRTRTEPTASVNTRSAPCPSSASTASGAKLAAGVAGAAQSAETLLADGENDRQRRFRRAGERALGHGHGGRDRDRVVADSRAAQPAVAPRDAPRRRLAEDVIDVNEDGEPVRRRAERPHQVAGLVRRTGSPASRPGAAAASRCVPARGRCRRAVRPAPWHPRRLPRCRKPQYRKPCLACHPGQTKLI